MDIKLLNALDLNYLNAEQLSKIPEGLDFAKAIKSSKLYLAHRHLQSIGEQK